MTAKQGGVVAPTQGWKARENKESESQKGRPGIMFTTQTRGFLSVCQPNMKNQFKENNYPINKFRQ